MKRSLLLIGFGPALTAASPLVGQSEGDYSPILQVERKIKTKNDRTIVRDKSKPVRKAIEEWYGRNIAAFKAKDVAAVMALRTDDFQTTTPDGKVNTRSDMEAYTERFLGRIDSFISQDLEIGTIELESDLASADITQATVRLQRLPDGSLHRVETRAVQRETWKKTSEGWKLHRVENVRSEGLWVDDNPYQPTQ